MSSPNYWLAEAREIAKDLKALDKKRRSVSVEFAAKGLRLATLVRALDNWLSDGTGLESLPEAWRPRIVGPAPKRRRPPATARRS